MTVTINVVTEAKGTINIPLHITSDIQGATSITWMCDKQVNYSVSLDQKTLNFTPSADGVYHFTITANDGQTSAIKTITVTVGGTSPPQPTPTPVPPAPTPEPTPTPTPTPSGNVLYDSHINSKLHDGKVRTITSEGNLSPGGLGVECRASGNPQIKVNADGTFTLVTGSGKIDNLSLRLRSRHNEGGSTDNRFGGYGASIHDNAIDFATEPYHNTHTCQSSKSHNINIRDGKFHKTVFDVKDGGNGVIQTCTLDSVSGTGGCKLYGTKSQFDQQSYIWIRANNSDYGRIYIYVKNYNARMEIEYRFDNGNSITFKSVKIIAI